MLPTINCPNSSFSHDMHPDTAKSSQHTWISKEMLWSSVEVSSEASQKCDETALTPHLKAAASGELVLFFSPKKEHRGSLSQIYLSMRRGMH